MDELVFEKVIDDFQDKALENPKVDVDGELPEMSAETQDFFRQLEQECRTGVRGVVKMGDKGFHVEETKKDRPWCGKRPFRALRWRAFPH